MRRRGFGDPLLVVSDGAAGIIKVIETCFPRLTLQRCFACRLRNLAAKVLADLWPEFKARATAAYQTPSRTNVCDLGIGDLADYQVKIADGEAFCLQGVVPHALVVLAKEGEFPFDLGPIRLCAIIKMAQRSDHLVGVTGVVTQNLAVPLEPVGGRRMVGCRSEIFACMPGVDDFYARPLPVPAWTGRSPAVVSQQLDTCAV